MSKLKLLDEKLLVARKENDILAKNLLSTFKGEIELESSKTDLPVDKLIETIATKMTKNADKFNTKDSAEEIEILKAFLPSCANEDELTNYLKEQDLSLGGRLIGQTIGYFKSKGVIANPGDINKVLKKLK